MAKIVKIIDGKKECTKCKKMKLLEDYHSAPNTSNGKSSSCKECKKLYYDNCYREKLQKRNIERRKEDPAQYSFVLANGDLKRIYGITAYQKYGFWLKQNKACAICYKAITDWRKAHTDHDHNTKEIRGLLCSNCNQGLGYFKDSLIILQNAI